MPLSRWQVQNGPTNSRKRWGLVSLLCLIGLASLLISLPPAWAQPATTRGYAPAALPPTIPIFPLADVMLFPRSSRPLHVFEQRYREMVADALEGDRLIGMVMLEPGYEDDYQETPPVFPIGCVGVITEAEELPDGRFNIVLGGLIKFRITSEDHSRAYRTAHIEAIPEQLNRSDTTALSDLREELASLVPIAIPGLQIPDGLGDEELVNGIAQLIDIAPFNRRGLLEQPGPLERAQALIDLLYIRASLPR